MADAVHVRQATEQDVRDYVPAEVDQRFFLRRLRQVGPWHGRVLMAFVDRVPAGHVYLRFPPAEEAELRELLPGVPLLERLLVFAEFRHRGVGAALVGNAERVLSGFGYEAVALGVDPRNTIAIQLYRRLGFRIWRDELVTTFKERIAEDGTLVRDEDLCRIFVKEF
jgi:GNAT superfamily N-acetyltransferase